MCIYLLTCNCQLYTHFVVVIKNLYYILQLHTYWVIEYFVRLPGIEHREREQKNQSIRFYKWNAVVSVSQEHSIKPKMIFHSSINLALAFHCLPRRQYARCLQTHIYNSTLFVHTVQVNCTTTTTKRGKKREKLLNRTWSSRRFKRIDADTKIEKTILFFSSAGISTSIYILSVFVMTDEAIYYTVAHYTGSSIYMCIFGLRLILWYASTHRIFLTHFMATTFFVGQMNENTTTRIIHIQSYIMQREMTYTRNSMKYYYAELSLPSLSFFFFFFLGFRFLIHHTLGLENLNLMCAVVSSAHTQQLILHISSTAQRL